MTEEAPIYSLWSGDGLPPILIRYGEKGFQNAIKVGEEWLPVSDVQVHFDPKGSHPYVAVKLYGHFRFEYAGPPLVVVETP